MTKGMLIGVIGAAVVAVAALAVLTPTVIVNNDSPDVGLVAAAAPPEIAPPRFAPAPQQRPFGELRGCLEEHGLGRPDRRARPDLRTLRDALKACRGTLPGPGFGR